MMENINLENSLEYFQKIQQLLSYFPEFDKKYTMIKEAMTEIKQKWLFLYFNYFQFLLFFSFKLFFSK